MDPRIATRRLDVAEAHARLSFGKLLTMLITVVVCGVMAWVMWRSPLFSIETIDVSGVVRAEIHATLAQNGIVSGAPMMGARLGRAADRLADDPWIARVEIGRRWPRAIVIAVSEREPIARIECGGKTVVVAPDGVVVSYTDPESIGHISIPRPDCGSLADDLEIAAALDFISNLPVRLAKGAEISVGADGLEALIGGYLVRIGGPEDGAAKAKALVAVLADPPPEGSVITLIAPTRPAVLPPSSTTTVEETGEGN